MTELWDTFELIQGLLDNFESLLWSARQLNITETQDSLPIKAAITGFSQFSPLSDWSQQHFEFIVQRLQDEPSVEALIWYEECAKSVAVFSCLTLGAFLGKYQAGKIGDADFLLGDAHLASFLALRNEEICMRYSAISDDGNA